MLIIFQQKEKVPTSVLRSVTIIRMRLYSNLLGHLHESFFYFTLLMAKILVGPICYGIYLDNFLSSFPQLVSQPASHEYTHFLSYRPFELLVYKITLEHAYALTDTRTINSPKKGNVSETIKVERTRTVLIITTM